MRWAICAATFLLVGNGLTDTTPRRRPTRDNRIGRVDHGVPCCDPAVVATPDGETVYVFGTGDALPFWRSTDLRKWELAGKVFPEGVPAWARGKVPKSRGFWAPDIAFFNGRYHVYYSVSSWGSQRSVIGLAVETGARALHGFQRHTDAGRWRHARREQPRTSLWSRPQQRAPHAKGRLAVPSCRSRGANTLGTRPPDPTALLVE